MEKFIDSILDKYPELREKELTDITDHSAFPELEDYMKLELINYDKVKRVDLYRLSMLIEKYAGRASEPLVAIFETEHLYKYVEKRYIKLLEHIPKAWIIGGFDNPFFAPETPPTKAEILTCAGTNLQDTWIVLSKGPDGPFGLVAEDLGGVEKGDWFRGFFTTKPDIIQDVIKKINSTMMTDIDFFNLKSSEGS